jgi:hypothetical protein
MRHPAIITTLIVALSSGLLRAQEPPRAPDPGFRELRVDEVKPAFSIEPVVQRLQGRRGQLLSFKFDVTSLARTTTIEILPVAMTQELSGAIGPDTENPPPVELQISTPSRIELVQDAEITIEGTIRLPATESPYHTYGILVTDFGRDLDATEVAPPPDAPQATLEFVTRYLLRIDIEVDGVRPANVGKLVIESADLKEVQGYPLARIVIVNPTDGPLEFGGECKLISPADAGQLRSFPLHMPVRENMEPPDRYLARILPGARIHLEEFVPTALFPGPYELEVSLLADRRRWNTLKFPVLVEDTAFPGLATQVAPIGTGLSASPAQIELSTLRGGKRHVAVTLTNTSSTEATFNLAAVDGDDNPLPWVNVRPDSLTLLPGGSRKVLLTLASERPSGANIYGRLRIAATSAGGAALGQTELLTVISVSEPPVPQLQLGALGWKVDGDVPAIVLPVTNPGTAHVPLAGRLSLTDIERGSRYEFSAGYGRWLLPGATGELRFRITESVPSARYELRVVVRQGDAAEALELKSIVEFSSGN